VKPLTSAPLCPLGLSTVTATAPLEFGGVAAMIVELPIAMTLVAATPPKRTVAPAAKLTPVIVTHWPPFRDPELGETLEIVGAEDPRGTFATYVKTFEAELL
jgi:hypothetical protein